MVAFGVDETEVSSLAHTFLCMAIGFVFAYAGFLVIAIFWPLLFPLSLEGRTPGENAVVVAMPAVSLLFGTGGFLLCRRLTQRLVRQDDSDGGYPLLR